MFTRIFEKKKKIEICFKKFNYTLMNIDLYKNIYIQLIKMLLLLKIVIVKNFYI